MDLTQNNFTYGVDLDSIGSSPFMWGRSHYKHPGKWLGSGNRCGHNPSSPAWHLFQAPETKKPLPLFIQDLIGKVRNYYAQPNLLPTLANLNGKLNKDRKPRLNRSEAREAECLVLEAILSQTEFASLRVGTPLPDGRFIHRSLTDIAQLVGMINPKTELPTQRFWRAIRRLKIGGALDIHRQYETLADGTMRARPGIKSINMHFLIALGRVSYERLKKFRTWCSKKLKKASEEHREEHPAAHDPEIANRRLREQQRERGTKTNPVPSTQSTLALVDPNRRKELQRQHSKAMLEYVMNLPGKYPGRSEEWYNKQALLFPRLDDWIAQQDN